MPEDKQKLKDGQRDCISLSQWAKEKGRDDGSIVVPEEPSHLGRALGR